MEANKIDQSPPTQPLMAMQMQMTNQGPTPSQGLLGSVSVGFYGSFLEVFGTCWGCVGTCTCCFCAPYTTVRQGEYGVITRFGRYSRTVEPGLVYVTPCVEEIRRVDTRLCTLEMSRQTTLSRDNITMYTDIVMLYRIVNVHVASFQVQNLELLLRQCAFSTIRQVFGQKTLQELLEKRHEIANDVYGIVEHDARNWGVHIDSINIKDLIIPDDVTRAMSAAAVARREAEAKVILASADVEAAKLMRAAADALSSDAAMQIRYLEQLRVLAESNNAKIVFFPSGMGAGGIDSQLNRVNAVESLAVKR